MSHSITSVLRRAWKRVSTASSRSAAAPIRSPHRAKLAVEAFEDRVVPASVIVEESTFDPDVFGQTISDALDFNIVGYAYAINHNGNAVASSGTGGLYGPNEGRARTSADEPETVFEIDTRIDMNSVSKIITTVAVLHLLETEYDNLDDMLSTPISEFLPSDWIMGPNVNLITVRHLLTHTSGFVEDSSNAIGVNFEGFSNNNFQNLRDLLEAGLGAPTGTLPDGSPAYARSYSNSNFSLLAKMIPYMPPNEDVREFLDDFSLNNPDQADALFGILYTSYVATNILMPSGIVNPSMIIDGENPSLGYVFADVVDDVEGTPGIQQIDYTDFGGAFGWKLSAPDMALFMNSLRQSNALLSDNARELMNSETFMLGWAPGSTSGPNPYNLVPTIDAFGSTFTHGGAGRGFRSEIVMFPGEIDVALGMNSFQSDDAFPEGIGDRFEFLRFAYSTAWTDLVIEGDNNANTFELRLNAVDPNLLDLVVDDAPLLSFRLDVLESLQIRGLGGDDTFVIEDLPENVDLVLDGGADDDTFLFGNQLWFSTFPYVAGNVNIVGGTGHDSVDINEGNGSGLGSDYAITGINNPELTVQGRFDASNYTPGKLFLYEGVDDLVLWANIDPNQIAVTGIANPMTIAIHAGENHDTILISSLAAEVTVNVYGGFGNDTLNLGDGNLGTVRGTVFFEGGNGADLIVLDDADAPAPAGRGYLFTLGSVNANGGFGEVTYSTGVENVRLHASSGNDAVNIESLGATTDLELYGHDGTDIFWIAGLSENIDEVLGDVVIHGGNGYPPSHLPPMAFPEDDDQLYVRDDNNLVAGIYTINLHLGNVLVGRFNKLGGNPSELPPNVIYDQIERTELHTGNGDDTITVTAAPRFNHVSVFAGPGMDQIDVESTPLFAPMQVFGEGGVDTIRVSPFANKLGNLHSLLSVNGGSGAAGELDTLTIDDSLSDNVAAYSLGGSSLSRPGSAGVAFEKVEHLVVSLSDAANVINVSATVAGTMVDIFGKAGNDTLTASNLASSVTFFGGLGLDDRAYLIGTNGPDTISITGNTMVMGAGSLTSFAEYREADGRGGMDTFHVGNGDVDSIGSEPVLRGGGDSDALYINDQDDLGNDTYTVTVNQVSKPGFLLLYDTMELLTLNAGADNNTINIHSTTIGTPVVVNAGAGGDLIHISPTAQNLSFITGLVTVNGQQGVDTVFLRDDLFALGGFFPYTLTRSTVSRSFFGGLGFDTIERLRLNLGSGNNTVNVTTFNPDVLFALYGNVGKDTFNVTVFPALGDTGGRLFIDGGGNVDRLNVAYASKPEVPEKPKVHHKKNPPTAGTITVEYLAAFYDIQYTSLEVVTVDKI
jgi:CubicO group peptidase (beta-lactamase class C family)